MIRHTRILTFQARHTCFVILLLTMGLATAAQPSNAQSNVTNLAGSKNNARALTLEDVLVIALQNNSSIAQAQERLRKAGESIVQVEAQGRPQLRADLTDTISSERAFGTSGGGSLFTPSLPGGGQIPVVIDQGGGSSSGFVGGGGGGTTASTGQAGTSAGSSAGTGTGRGNTTNGAGSNTTGQGSTPANGSGTGSSVSHAMFASLPAIVQEFAIASGTSISSGVVTSNTSGSFTPVSARDTTTGSTGTGNPTTGTSTVITRAGQNNNYSGRLTVTQYLDVFNLVGTARDVERITRDFYLYDLQRVQNETALSVKNTFFDVLRAQTLVSVQQEQVRYATENVRIAQARFDAGAAAQFDVVTAQTAQSNANQQLISAQNQLALAQANLNNLIGVSQDEPLNLQPPEKTARQTPDLKQTLETAYGQRPELRQAENNITIARKLITLASATLKPSLALVGGANYLGASASTSGRKDTYTISAELGIPLSDGGTTKSRVRAAQIDLDTQMLTRSQLRQNVELEVRQAIINVNNAQARTTAATQGVTQAQEAVRLSQVRYQNGLGTFLEVTNSQTQLAQARTNLSTAEFDTQTALAQLTRAVGGQ